MICEPEIVRTRGLRDIDGLGRGCEVKAGRGNHGIQSLRVVDVARGLGELVFELPSFPFFTVMII